MNMYGLYRSIKQNQTVEIKLGTLVAVPAKTHVKSWLTKMRETKIASPYSKIESALNMDKERSGCEISLEHSKDNAMILPPYLDDLETTDTYPSRRPFQIAAQDLSENEEQPVKTKTFQVDLNHDISVDDDGKKIARPTAGMKQGPFLVQPKEIIPVPLLYRKDCNGPWKTILLFGDSSTGKSTTINSMVNYLMAVQYHDPFTYRLVAGTPTERGAAVLSSTKDVTAYNFYPLQPDIHYGVTIIDTPGFCGHVGARKNKAVWKKIKDFVETEVIAVDAVCLTIRAGSSRWLSSQQYCYEKVLKLFGKEIVQNIFTLITFSDTKTTPLTSTSVYQVGGSCRVRYVKLNTSAFLRGFYELRKDQDVAVDDVGQRDDVNKGTDENAWGEDCRTFRQLFADDIFSVPTKSIRTKRSDSSERESLENVVMAINSQIRNGLDKLECIRQAAHCIRQCQQELDANAIMKVKVPKATFRKVSFQDKNMYATTCLICNFTRKERRDTSNEGDEVKRHAIEYSYLCQFCRQTSKCSQCKILSYWIEYSMEWVDEFLLQKNEVAKATSRGISYTGAALLKQRAKYVTTKMQVHNDIDTVWCSIERLELCPGGLGPKDYIQQMIHSELMRKEFSFLARVQYLQAIKEESRFPLEEDAGSLQQQDNPKDSALAEIDQMIEDIVENNIATTCDDQKGMFARVFEYARGTQGLVASSQKFNYGGK